MHEKEYQAALELLREIYIHMLVVDRVSYHSRYDGMKEKILAFLENAEISAIILERGSEPDENGISLEEIEKWFDEGGR